MAHEVILQCHKGDLKETFTNGEANHVSSPVPGTVGTNSTKYMVLNLLGSSVQQGDAWVRELLLEGTLAYMLN